MTAVPITRLSSPILRTTSLLGLLSLVAAGVADAQVPRAERAQDAPRILNGTMVDGTLIKAPWIMSLRRDGNHVCGASFIHPLMRDGRVSDWSSDHRNPVWAVTAAHCVTDRTGDLIDTGRLSVWGGVLDFNAAEPDNGEVQAVQAAFLPDDHDRIGAYDPLTLTNDVALLRLQPANLDLQNKRRSIRLPKVREAGWLHDSYTAVSTAGWGRTSQNGPASSALLEVRLPMVDDRRCRQAFAPFGDTLQDSMLCAGFASGEYDSCQGDSGGPLYFRPSHLSPLAGEPILVGIVSWGRGCGSADLFGIYTRIAYVKDWIEGIVADEMS